MKKKIIIPIICLIVITIVILGFIKKVDVIKYSINSDKLPEEFNNFKIVQLSDFHSNGYKDTTDIIISKVKKIKPDIIVMTGDMINWDLENNDKCEKLIENLSKESTIYYINGNHEQLAEILKKEEYNNFIDKMKKLDVVFINDESVKIYKNDESINLYEIDIPLDGPTGLYATEEQVEDNYVDNTLSKIDSEKFNVLLAHNPLFIKQYSSWGADLVLSGHMHGGIARIPLLGIGIASPEKGYFPKYDAGKFKVDDTTMIINRGIGTSSINIRIFNKPEITLITLKKS